MEFEWKKIITQQEIQKKILEVSHKIKEDYKNKELVLFVILKGAICLAVDLLKELSPSTSIEMVEAKSYRGVNREKLSFHLDKKLQITNRHLLVVEDIYDSGHTLSAVCKKLQEKKPASLSILSLLVKEIKREKELQLYIHYPLFTVGDDFLVGYGLDYCEKYRGLKDIYILEGKEK